MEKESKIILIAIILTIIIASILAYIDPLDIKGLFKSVKEGPTLCKQINGTWENIGFGRCYGYDAEGFRFYYKIDENGRVYKIR